MKPRYFMTQAAWRAWLEKNHGTEEELWVGFHKRGSGKASITWPQSVDEALCFGWIDGIRKSIDEDRYVIRFTPRKRASNWSAINIARMGELIAAGLVHERGLAAFEARRADRSAIYAYENRKDCKLAPEYAAMLAANAKAKRFFDAQAPWYQRTASYWVMSAKKEETRGKRLAVLARDSAAGRRIAQLTPKKPAG